MKSPPSLKTRPTSDRLRETLFNVLAPRIKGARFLDLCAGSGAVGIEALSRDAAHATFVDQSKEMCSLIEANLQTLKVDEADVEVLNTEATEFMRRRAQKEAGAFDIAYYDPPYETDYEVVLEYLGDQSARIFAEGGILVVEYYWKNNLKEEFGGLKRYRVLKQGDSCLSFYEAS